MLWTIGVFALNFGPVIVGPILDYVGPKLTAMFGEHQVMPVPTLAMFAPFQHGTYLYLAPFLCA